MISTEDFFKQSNYSFTSIPQNLSEQPMQLPMQQTIPNENVNGFNRINEQSSIPQVQIPMKTENAINGIIEQPQQTVDGLSNSLEKMTIPKMETYDSSATTNKAMSFFSQSPQPTFQLPQQQNFGMTNQTSMQGQAYNKSIILQTNGYPKPLRYATCNGVVNGLILADYSAPCLAIYPPNGLVPFEGLGGKYNLTHPEAGADKSRKMYGYCIQKSNHFLIEKIDELFEDTTWRNDLVVPMKEVDKRLPNLLTTKSFKTEQGEYVIELFEISDKALGMFYNMEIIQFFAKYQSYLKKINSKYTGGEIRECYMFAKDTNVEFLSALKSELYFNDPNLESKYLYPSQKTLLNQYQMQNQLVGQMPGQMTGQYPNQIQNPYLAQNPNQVQNQYPNQVQNQYPNQVQSQVQNQYPNQMESQVPNQMQNSYLTTNQAQINNQYPQMPVQYIPLSYPISNQPKLQPTIQQPNQMQNQQISICQDFFKLLNKIKTSEKNLEFERMPNNTEIICGEKDAVELKLGMLADIDIITTFALENKKIAYIKYIDKSI